jgi:hypothetical protein
MLPNVAQVLENFSTVVPDLMALVTACAFVGGMWMVIANVAGLRNAAYISMAGQNQRSVTSHIICLLIGGALMYLASTVQVGTATFWKDTSPFAYTQDSGNPYETFINVVYQIIALVGTIGLIRGFYILASGKDDQSNHGTFHGHVARGFTHIIGGIFCINIHLFLQTVFTTLGLIGILSS